MKGLGLSGAVGALMRAGYRFPRVAGTSAGAVVAALLAAGIEEPALAAATARLDYARVPDRASPKIPHVSEAISLLGTGGAYKGDYIREYLAEELARLGVVTFGDLRNHDAAADGEVPPYRRYKLVVMPTDISHGRLLRLPWDYAMLGLDPDEQVVADAVRASISIPLYFEPVVLRDAAGADLQLVDGGVLSNFPIEIFDRADDRSPRWPTFGVRIFPELPAAAGELFPDTRLTRLAPVRILEQVLATAIVGHDQTYPELPCVRRRTITVDTRAVGIVEFDASPEQRATVLANGMAAAERFLASWNWQDYLRDCGERPDGATP